MLLALLLLIVLFAVFGISLHALWIVAAVFLIVLLLAAVTGRL